MLYALGALLILIGLLWNLNIGVFMSEVLALLTCAHAISLRLRARSTGAARQTAPARPRT